MDEVLAEWEQLCKEHDAARDAYFFAFGPVNQKFTKSQESERKLTYKCTSKKPFVT
jgi:hypothetical protein